METLLAKFCLKLTNEILTTQSPPARKTCERKMSLVFIFNILTFFRIFQVEYGNPAAKFSVTSQINWFYEDEPETSPLSSFLLLLFQH